MTPQELKNSILQLAIQGKLVPQRAEEGNAEELYKQIQAEKKKLIKEKKIKKEQPLPEITDDEKPFDIPDTWKWVRLGEVIQYSLGKTPPRAEEKWWGNDVPWVSISDMPENGHITLTKEKITTEALSQKFKNKISKAGTLLMSFKLTVGRVSILDIDAVHNEAIISILPYIDDNQIFKNYLFNSLPYITNYAETKNAIKGQTLNSSSIKNLLFPLPPLAEQKRIVAKIEELLPYVDQYEKAYNELQELDKRFPGDLQKSILQLAIQGKLVPQRAEEGTAEELYKQIQTEKKKLIKEKKIKKEKPLPEITDDEKPFDIPETWKWVRLGEIGFYKKGPFGSALTKSMFVPKSKDTIKVYEQKNAIKKDVSIGDYYIKKDYFENKMKGFELFPGDIIVSCAGTIGETYVMPANFERGIINQALMKIKLFEPTHVPYFLMYFDFILKKNAKINSKGSAIKNIPPFEILKKYVVPIPPLAEQKRIVAKIEELLPLCEKLKN